MSEDAAQAVSLLVREGCHLCRAVEEELGSLRITVGAFAVRDIDKDRGLHDEYFLRVPVVLVGGEAVFEAAMLDAEGRWRVALREALRSRSVISS